MDFVDVDTTADIPVYIDPQAIRLQTGDWADECILSIQTYFAALLGAVRRDDIARIKELIVPLQEPNETHLGESIGRSRGRSLGSQKKADELISNLRSSRAAQTGRLRDLEDAALFVAGVDRDVISDMTTCIIREQLILYTQDQCRFHSIPMELQDSGPMWDSGASTWMDAYVDLPRAGENKLLLVPKSIVRLRLSVDTGRYYRGYLRPYYEDIELSKPSSEFVRTVKQRPRAKRGGAEGTTRRVMKGKLDKHLGKNKAAIEAHTERFPQALRAYKRDLDAEGSTPLPDSTIHGRTNSGQESLADLLDEIKAVAPGHAGANNYHRSVAKFLTALFDTQLGNERIEQHIHGGLKRIDITYDNVAGEGFFHWLRKNYRSALVPVECKNYRSDVNNPEFDQLALRFSPHRGQFGLLVCRSLQDIAAANARAASIAHDGHGYVIVLTDDDLGTLAEAAADPSAPYDYPLLRAKFEVLLGIG
ncbi:hypothetical protein [Naumannella huperziae]